MTYVEYVLFLKIIKQSNSVDKLDDVFMAIPWNITTDKYVKEVWQILSEKMRRFSEGSSNDIP